MTIPRNDEASGAAGSVNTKTTSNQKFITVAAQKMAEARYQFWIFTRLMNDPVNMTLALLMLASLLYLVALC